MRNLCAEETMRLGASASGADGSPGVPPMHSPPITRSSSMLTLAPDEARQQREQELIASLQEALGAKELAEQRLIDAEDLAERRLRTAEARIAELSGADEGRRLHLTVAMETPTQRWMDRFAVANEERTVFKERWEQAESELACAERERLVLQKQLRSRGKQV